MDDITKDFMDKVYNSVKDTDGMDRETSDVMAHCVWNENWPLAKAKFEEDEIQFSDDDDQAVEGWLDTLDNYMEEDPDHIGFEESSNDDDTKGVDEMPPDLSVVAQTLNLPKNASADAVQRAIAKLQGNQFSEEDQTTLQELKEKDQLATYTEAARPFDAVPGTLDEKAARLMAIHTGVGQIAYDAQLSDWTAFQEMAGKQRVTEAVLVPASAAINYSASEKAPETEPGPAALKIQAHAEKEKISFNEALAQLSQQGGDGLETFKLYYAEEEASRK